MRRKIPLAPRWNRWKWDKKKWAIVRWVRKFKKWVASVTALPREVRGDSLVISSGWPCDFKRIWPGYFFPTPFKGMSPLGLMENEGSFPFGWCFFAHAIPLTRALQGGWLADQGGWLSDFFPASKAGYSGWQSETEKTSSIDLKIVYPEQHPVHFSFNIAYKQDFSKWAK